MTRNVQKTMVALGRSSREKSFSAGIWPSHAAHAATRTPPSYSVALPARYLPLSVTRPGAGPPLSLEKTNSVSFRTPAASTAATIVPTASSIAATIPA